MMVFIRALASHPLCWRYTFRLARALGLGFAGYMARIGFLDFTQDVARVAGLGFIPLMALFLHAATM
jgi:hypothetical protein